LNLVSDEEQPKAIVYKLLQVPFGLLFEHGDVVKFVLFAQIVLDGPGSCKHVAEVAHEPVLRWESDLGCWKLLLGIPITVDLKCVG